MAASHPGQTDRGKQMNPTIGEISGVIEQLLERASRVNERQNRRFWYPLSAATYGVDEILQALDAMCGLRTTMWERTQEFESRFSAYQGSSFSTMVNSGSSADLLLSFMLIDPRHKLVSPGDEILVPALTWPTHIWSPLMAGLKVRLVDVDPDTLNIDLNDLVAKIGPRTRALFLVHLLGNPCDMTRVQQITESHGLVLLEDCCEALGSEYNGIKVGNFGIGSSFSFFFSHHLCTMEGGMICTDDPEKRDILRMLRAYGWTRDLVEGRYDLEGLEIDPRYAFVGWGFNVRPTEVQAGFGLAQLDRLAGFNARRHALAERFFKTLTRWPALRGPVVAEQANPCWFALPLMVHPEAPFSRTQMARFLEDNGVETRPIVVGNIARHPVARVIPELLETPLPGADQVHDRGLYVGLSPLTSDRDLSRLLDLLDTFMAGKS